MKTSYEEKIRALLRKAERTDSTHEAEALTAKAEALMIKWGIDDLSDDLTEKNPGREIGTRTIRYTGPLRGDMTKLFGHAVARGLLGSSVRCIRVLDRDGDGESFLRVVGFEDDLRRFAILHESLVIQLDHAIDTWLSGALDPRFKIWWPTLTASQKRRAKTQFVGSFATTVYTRLAAEREKATKNANQSYSTALARRDADVTDAFHEMHPKTRRARGIAPGAAHARRAGTDAGSRANLGASLDRNAREAIR